MYTSTLDRPPTVIQPSVDQPPVKRPRQFGAGDYAFAATVGLVAGVVAGIYLYQQTQSLWLAFFVFAEITYLLGMGLLGILSGTHRIERAIYLLLHPILSVAVLAGVYSLWNVLWLAVLAGLFVGGMFHAILGWILFPQVKREQREERRAQRWSW